MRSSWGYVGWQLSPRISPNLSKGQSDFVKTCVESHPSNPSTLEGEKEIISFLGVFYYQGGSTTLIIENPLMRWIKSEKFLGIWAAGAAAAHIPKPYLIRIRDVKNSYR